MTLIFQALIIALAVTSLGCVLMALYATRGQGKTETRTVDAPVEGLLGAATGRGRVGTNTKGEA